MFSKLISFGLSCGCLLTAVQISAADLIFSGNHYPVIEIIPDKSTGLDRIYVLKELKGVSVSYESETVGVSSWSIFSNLGAAYSESINNLQIDGNKSTLSSIAGNHGYIVESGSDRFAFWIVDYSDYYFNIEDISCSDNTDCESTILDFNGEAASIYYYTLNGRQEILSRDIEIKYSNLRWNNEQLQFIQEDNVKKLSSISSTVRIVPPIYCDTEFIVSGDRFLRVWNEEKIFTTDICKPYSVMLSTRAVQVDSDDNIDNIINSDYESYGGSAPCTISFTSYVTDGVAHVEWQMSDDPEFQNITYRIIQQDVEYTFIHDGLTYVRCVASNVDGSCEYYSEVYTVNIGSSELKIPNAFSPDGDGINDEWKVSYRSLLDFRCWIFDRNGHEIFYFDDPSKGWDGQHSGKPVKSGAYYYVVTATGSDGKRYKKSGDINIISSKRIK